MSLLLGIQGGGGLCVWFSRSNSLPAATVGRRLLPEEATVRKARSLLLTLLLGAFTVKVLWWVVAPFIPYLVSLLAIVMVLGFIYYRMTRW